jgi:isopenicillin N synthase-like dioxygenase
MQMGANFESFASLLAPSGIERSHMNRAEHSIPTIDLAPFLRGGEAEKHEVARQVDEACKSIGFFTIVGHGVPEDLIAATRKVAVDFFALPTEEKLKIERPPQKTSRGYFGFKDRSIAYSLGEAAPPDLQEAFGFGPEGVAFDSRDEQAQAMLAPNLWPDRPAEFRSTMLAYRKAMTDLSMNFLRAVATALDVREEFFKDKFDRQPSAIRLIRYPAVTERPQPGQLRAGAHTDYGVMTYIRGDDTPGGLQVRHRNGDWIDVHPDPKAFVCNIGDLMARWSNDRWVSTLHRVAVPPPEAEPKDRISLVFFQTPNHDADIRCFDSCVEPGREPKYPPIKCSDHYLPKLMKASHARLDASAKDAFVN